MVCVTFNELVKKETASVQTLLRTLAICAQY